MLLSKASSVADNAEVILCTERVSPLITHRGSDRRPTATLPSVACSTSEGGGGELIREEMLKAEKKRAKFELRLVRTLTEADAETEGRVKPK